MLNTLAASIFVKMPVVTFSAVLHEFLNSDMHSAWGCTFQIPRKAHSRVGASCSSERMQEAPTTGVSMKWFTVDNTTFIYVECCIVMLPIVKLGFWHMVEQNWQKWHFHDRTLLHLAVFYMALGHWYESCWSQRHSKRMSGHLNELLTYLWWSYTAFA